MKRLVLVFAVCITVLGSSALWANASLLLKGGMELGGEYEISVGSDASSLDVDPSFTFGAEIIGQTSDNFEIGAGVMYQVQRKLDGDDKSEFGYIPIYGLIRVSQRGTGIYRFGGIAQLGFSPLTGNDYFKGDADFTAGLYFGAGVFLHFTKEIYAEVMYRQCNASTEMWNTDFDLKTSNVGIMLGYRLPM